MATWARASRCDTFLRERDALVLVAGGSAGLTMFYSYAGLSEWPAAAAPVDQAPDFQGLQPTVQRPSQPSQARQPSQQLPSALEPSLRMGV